MGSQNQKMNEKGRRTSQATHVSSNSGIMNSGNFSVNNISNLRKNIFNSARQELINTVFKWNFGGKTVYLTGTFTNWKNHLPMEKLGNEFSLIMRLPKGTHLYKFIVDGEWRFSPDDPTKPDEQGNINNVIDTSDDARSGNISSFSSNISVTPHSSIKAMMPSAKLNIEKGDVALIKEMTQKDFAEKAPPLPPHLLHIHYMMEKQRKVKAVWEPKPGEINKDNTEALFRSFESFNGLPPPSHVVLNHLGSLGNSTSNYKIYVITQRFKAKYATIKFYTPTYSGQTSLKE